MAPSPFRSAAVVCGIVTASLGVGLLTPAVATAAPTSAEAGAPDPASTPIRPSDSNPDFDSIPVDPSLTAPQFYSDWSTPYGSRVVAGHAEGDPVWLVIGNTVYDHSPSGAFFLTVQDRHKDDLLEVIRVHTAADGTQTRSERVPMPRSLQVAGVREQNTFTPGTNHFSGSATAGATIVATDTRSGSTLFTTKVGGGRSGVGTWSADATLAAETEYSVTFTQTTTDGRTNGMRGIAFTPTASDAPAAPNVQSNERRLDGSFLLSGPVDDDVTSVIAEDDAGDTIATAKISDGTFVVQVPQDRLGSTVHVVAHTDGAASPRTPVRLEQLPTDTSVAKPTLRNVFVHPNGDVQVIGERDGAAALWFLQGDHVIAGVPHQEAWSYTIKADRSDAQIDIANLGFAPEKGLSSLSERVALPRLLRVEGLAEDNTYTPGKRAFAGTAEAGATITATDQRGQRLFETKVGAARSGVGTWNAAADLTSTAGYELTFTQTTTDGRSSVMRDVAFRAETQQVVPVAVATKSVTAGTTNTFTGTATPGATYRVLNPYGTQIVPGTHQVAADGTWSFDRVVSKGATKLDFVIEQTVNGTATKSNLFSVAASATAPVTVATKSVTAGTTNTFTGTATPGATYRVLNPYGTQIVPGTHQVAADGTWSFDRVVSKGATKLDFVIEQTVNGTATKSNLFSIAAS